MVSIPAFSATWPHLVTLAPETNWEEAYFWLIQRADDRCQLGSELYTSFSNQDWGFKDKALAMEFKLRFG